MARRRNFLILRLAGCGSKGGCGICFEKFLFLLKKPRVGKDLVKGFGVRAEAGVRMVQGASSANGSGAQLRTF